MTNRGTGFMKLAALGGLAAILGMGGTTILQAQPATGGEPPKATAPMIPTTKILAIGRLTPKGSQEAIAPVLPAEVRDTVRLYLAGKIDQWYLKSDQSGVVFIMNVTSASEARALLEKLPLGVAGFMEFELTPIGPLGPLNALLAEPVK